MAVPPGARLTAPVTAVVLSWNGREDTLACLESLAAATYPRLSVVVVDNASTDGAPGAVAGEFPDVRLIALDENRGFAGGVDVGLTAALEDGADSVLLLNNDATVEPGFLEPLVTAAAADGVGAACAQILDAATGRVWYAGATYDPRRGHQGRHTGYGLPPLPPETAPYETDRACGGAMLIPRSALERVGPLETELFAYAEDVEWSLRARAAGLRIVVVPASVVHHRVSASSGGASSPDSLYYALRNGLVVAERAAPLGRLGTARRRAEAAAAFVAQALRSRTPLEGLRAVLAGMGDARRLELGPRRR
ncbi:MAG: glycosyltransferase family 2 protein [Gaiella sp.]|nr:glycosyltransferase family 2 protein [Gaiella sp.]